MFITMAKKTLRTHNIYIEDSEWNKVKRLAEQREESSANVIRKAIKEYLKNLGL